MGGQPRLVSRAWFVLQNEARLQLCVRHSAAFAVNAGIVASQYFTFPCTFTLVQINCNKAIFSMEKSYYLYLRAITMYCLYRHYDVYCK